MSIPSLSLAGKVAIVTGGKTGIGRSVALTFAEAGADVTVCSRAIEDEQLQAVAEEIQRLGRRSMAIRTDVSRKADVDNLVKQVMGEFGAIDILVNCAAITKWVPLLDLAEDDWDSFVDIDLKGYFLCAQAVGRIMVKQKRGNIINFASTASFKPLLERGAYDIVKAGAVMLTKHLAKELAVHNIRVNAIAPGMVKTEINRPLWDAGPETLKKYENKAALGRMGETFEISHVALFLASDLSSYMTGSTVVVDGGFLLL